MFCLGGRGTRPATGMLTAGPSSVCASFTAGITHLNSEDRKMKTFGATLRLCLPTVNRARRASAPVIPRDPAEPRRCPRQRSDPHGRRPSPAALTDARKCQRSESLGLRAGFCGERGSAFRTYQAPRYGRAGCRTVRTCSFHGAVDHCRLDDDQQWTSPHRRDDRSRAQAKLSVTRPLAAFAFPSKRPAMRASGSQSADPTLSKTPALLGSATTGKQLNPESESALGPRAD